MEISTPASDIIASTSQFLAPNGAVCSIKNGSSVLSDDVCHSNFIHQQSDIESEVIEKEAVEHDEVPILRHPFILKEEDCKSNAHALSTSEDGDQVSYDNGTHNSAVDDFSETMIKTFPNLNTESQFSKKSSSLPQKVTEKSECEVEATSEGIAGVEATGSAELEVISVIEQEPDSIVAQEPDSIVAQEPDSIVTQEPDSVVAQEPDSIVEQEPDSIVEQEPDSIVEQEPDSVVEQKPDSVVEQKPDSVVEQEDAAAMEILTGNDSTTEIDKTCEKKLVQEGRRGQETECDTSSCESESQNIESDADDEAEVEIHEQQEVIPMAQAVKDELPSLKKLSITACSEKTMVKIGTIKHLVDGVLLIQSIKDAPALDIDSILFDEKRCSIGEVSDVLGPVSSPLYSIQVDGEDVREELTSGRSVYYVPDELEWTKFVFMEELKSVKGSDASWKNNEEPPTKFVDYSDDEQERKAKSLRKKSVAESSNVKKSPLKSARAPTTNHSFVNADRISGGNWPLRAHQPRPVLIQASNFHPKNIVPSAIAPLIPSRMSPKNAFQAQAVHLTRNSAPMSNQPGRAYVVNRPMSVAPTNVYAVNHQQTSLNPTIPHPSMFPPSSSSNFSNQLHHPTFPQQFQNHVAPQASQQINANFQNNNSPHYPASQQSCPQIQIQNFTPNYQQNHTHSSKVSLIPPSYHTPAPIPTFANSFLQSSQQVPMSHTVTMPSHPVTLPSGMMPMPSSRPNFPPPPLPFAFAARNSQQRMPQHSIPTHRNDVSRFGPLAQSVYTGEQNILMQHYQFQQPNVAKFSNRSVELTAHNHHIHQ